MHVAQNWRLNGQRYAMKGVRCEKCEKNIFPPREVCPYCQKAAQDAAVTLSLQPQTARLERAAR
jgi:uncharacterized OB-fold protein